MLKNNFLTLPKKKNQFIISNNMSIAYTYVVDATPSPKIKMQEILIIWEEVTFSSSQHNHTYVFLFLFFSSFLFLSLY